jgi:hypothetical protein
MSRDAIVELLMAVLQEMLESLPDADTPTVSTETALIGDDSPFESIHFVQFLLECEERLTDLLGEDVILTDERAMSEKSSPFRSVNTLAEFVEAGVGNGV